MIAALLVAAAVTTAPEIIMVPSGEETAEYNPDDAQRDHVSGHVTMSCMVKLDGRLQLCEIRAESPAGYHFGQSAVRQARLYLAKPATVDGRPVEARTDVTINFSNP